MGFIDKVRATVKAGAEQAATKAQSEYEKMQRRRELDQAYGDLGVKAFELADRGELAHAELTPLVEEVRSVKANLAAGTEAPAEEPSAEQPVPEQPAPEQPPPATDQPPST
jgi:hypothetical protein